MLRAVSTCFRKYATFSGRAGRTEFGWFLLFAVLVDVALSVVTSLSITVAGGDVASAERAGEITSALWDYAVLLPCIAVAWRRTHDQDRSGWFLVGPSVLMLAAGWVVGIVAGALFAALAIVGGLIWCLVVMVLPGTDGPNRFGSRDEDAGRDAAAVF